MCALLARNFALSADKYILFCRLCRVEHSNYRWIAKRTSNDVENVILRDSNSAATVSKTNLGGHQSYGSNRHISFHFFNVVNKYGFPDIVSMSALKKHLKSTCPLLYNSFIHLVTYGKGTFGISCTRCR
jgi:hypothetical protein